MLQKIKCTITKNDKVLESLAQTADFNNFTESLNTFELALNALITKLINDAGDLDVDCNADEESDDSNSEDLSEQNSPKKKIKVT